MFRNHLTYRKDGVAAISGVDQRLRECIQTLWLTLPPENRNIDALETHFHRLSERALRDFKEDLQHFPPTEVENSLTI